MKHATDIAVCGGVGDRMRRGWLGQNGPVDAPPRVDAATAPDASTLCDPMAAFDPPRPLDELSATLRNTAGSPSLTADERSVYFDDSFGNLYVAHRGSITEPFEPPNLIPVVNGPFSYAPAVSADQRELWFTSFREADGLPHLYVATRLTTSDDFTRPAFDSNVNAPRFEDATPFLTADGQQLWFSSSRTSTSEPSPGIWHATREGRSFTTPRLEAAFLGSEGVLSYSDPVLSADRRTIYVARRDMAQGSIQVWRSHRVTVANPFPPPTRVNELDMIPGWLSPDNCRLYVTASVPLRVYVAVRHP